MEKKSLRMAYGEALVAEGKTNPDIVVLEADLGKSTMSCLFKDAYPERHFEMGIAEQNMASTAAGLALAGKIPFYSTFAVFAIGRAYDQIRCGIAIPQANVRICGSSCGLSDFGDGKTHQSIEEANIMCTMPNMTVLNPCDAVEVQKMIKATLTHQGPVYIRVNRNDLPVYTTAPVNLELSEDGADGTMDIVVDDVETAKNDLSVTVTNSTNPTLIATSDVTVTVGTNGTRTLP